MTETPLIIIELSPRQNIGFTVKAGEQVDRILLSYKEEIALTLEHLARQLRNEEYPFGQLKPKKEL